MTEQKLNIKTNGEYKNIYLKEVEPNNYALIKKESVEGHEITTKYGQAFIINTEYEGTKVSFLLNPKQHEAWKVLGGIGDTIRVTTELVENPRIKGTFYKNLSFTLEE